MLPEPACTKSSLVLAEQDLFNWRAARSPDLHTDFGQGAAHLAILAVSLAVSVADNPGVGRRQAMQCVRTACDALPKRNEAAAVR